MLTVPETGGDDVVDQGERERKTDRQTDRETERFKI